MRIVSLILALFLIVPIVGADQSLESPEDLTRRVSEQVLDVLNKEKSKLKNNPGRLNQLVSDIILPTIDFKAFAKLTLGKHWRSASKEQRDRYINEFKGMLIRTYTKYLVDYAGTEVRVLPRTGGAKKDRKTIFTEVKRPSKPALPVNYSFWFRQDEWKAYNVTVNGLSLVQLFRDDFSREINQTSLDALIERLAKTNHSALVPQPTKK